MENNSPFWRLVYRIHSKNTKNMVRVTHFSYFSNFHTPSSQQMITKINVDWSMSTLYSYAKLNGWFEILNDLVSKIQNVYSNWTICKGSNHITFMCQNSIDESRSKYTKTKIILLRVWFKMVMSKLKDTWAVAHYENSCVTRGLIISNQHLGPWW